MLINDLKDFYSRGDLFGFQHQLKNINGITDQLELLAIKEWLLKTCFHEMDYSLLQYISSITYIEQEYHETYLYSKMAWESESSFGSLIYFCLSILRLGYNQIAREIYESTDKASISMALQEINTAHAIEFGILFEVPVTFMPTWENESEDTFPVLLAKTYINQAEVLAAKRKNKHFCKILINILPELKDNVLIYDHICGLLGHYWDQSYYGKITQYIENRFYEDVLIDSAELSLADYKIHLPDTDTIKRGTNCFYYDYQDDTIIIKSYPMHETMVNMHLLITAEGCLIIDCGASLDQENNRIPIDIQKFFDKHGIQPEQIKGVIISHAHLDHYGSLGELLKITSCPVYMTKETLALITLLGATEIELDKITEFIEDTPVNIGGFSVSSFSNGHILGSCGFDILFNGKRLIFTGDFCLHNQYTVDGLNLDKLSSINEEHPVDYVITESTYGYKKSVLDPNDNYIVLGKAIAAFVKAGIKIIIPSFAIGRAQEVACALKEHTAMNYPAIIDGLAATVTLHYQQHSKQNKIIGDGIKIASHETIKDKLRKNTVFIMSSGMIQQGTTSNAYLKHLVDNPSNPFAVLQVGFISSNSIAFQWLKDLAGSLLVLVDLPLSAHATYIELIYTIIKLKPTNLIMVHGNGIKGLMPEVID